MNFCIPLYFNFCFSSFKTSSSSSLKSVSPPSFSSSSENCGTSLGNFNKHAIPPKLIKFTPFEEIISREWKKNMLIGRICSSLHTFQ
ncbi:unnamed protein product [Lathyrus oleraceus]